MQQRKFSADDHATVVDLFLAGHDHAVGLPVLREAVAFLREDSQRLDWIEQRADSAYSVCIEVIRRGSQLPRAASLREAIDEARGKESGA